MATTPGSASARILRRDRDAGWIGGVAAGIASRFGIDVSLVRLAFVVATAAGGFGLGAYLLAWILIPSGEPGSTASRLPTGRAAVEVALGTGLLLIAALLTFRALGIWFSDAVVWPLVLIAGGGALIWRQSLGGPEPAAEEPPTGAALGAEPPRQAALAAESRRAAAAISRTGLGVALVIAAGPRLPPGHRRAGRGARRAARRGRGRGGARRDLRAVDRAARALAHARSALERIRSQERAEMAAHLHDSVLQTLAMVQRSAGDPGEVAALARRQERELRAWLAGRPAPGQAARLAAALEAAAADVEERYGVPVEVVVVGDRELDGNHEAVVAAAREAMTNAAKFGGGWHGGRVRRERVRTHAGVRPRPRAGLRPRRGARRPPRRARVDRRPHGAPRRPRARSRARPAAAPRSSSCSRSGV